MSSRGMSDILIKESIEKCTLTSPISASSDAIIHKYDDFQDLIVTSVTARGLLSLCMFLIQFFIHMMILLLF